MRGTRFGPLPKVTRLTDFLKDDHCNISRCGRPSVVPCLQCGQSSCTVPIAFFSTLMLLEVLIHEQNLRNMYIVEIAQTRSISCLGVAFVDHMLVQHAWHYHPWVG